MVLNFLLCKKIRVKIKIKGFTMKLIRIYSHVLDDDDKIFSATNGDEYDSVLEVYDDNGTMIYQSERVNVDSTNELTYLVEMVNGTYAGIVGKHRNKYKGIFVYTEKYRKKIKKWKDFRVHWKARRVPCYYPNPNWNGKKVLYGINIHKGGNSWDYSHGCITIHLDEYDNFIKHFEYNEQVVVVKE